MVGGEGGVFVVTKFARLFSRQGRGAGLSIPDGVMSDYGLKVGDKFQVTVWANNDSVVLSFKKAVV